jgi:RNA polymerase sigma-70 factor (ECF subfamily)
VAKHTADLELVERMLAGEEAAFAAFGERYLSALYRFALGRLEGEREAARDTVQTTMTKALAKLDTYRGDASLLTWLCSCCKNEILMLFRSRRSAPAEVELEEETLPAAALGGARDPSRAAAQDPEAALLRRERATLVHMALDLLPPHYARALEWKYLERLSVEEIGARLGVGTKAAESLLTRAREAFRGGFASVEAAAVAGEDRRGA